MPPLADVKNKGAGSWGVALFLTRDSFLHSSDFTSSVTSYSNSSMTSRIFPSAIRTKIRYGSLICSLVIPTFRHHCPILHLARWGVVASIHVCISWIESQIPFDSLVDQKYIKFFRSIFDSLPSSTPQEIWIRSHVAENARALNIGTFDSHDPAAPGRHHYIPSPSSPLTIQRGRLSPDWVHGMRKLHERMSLTCSLYHKVCC